MSQETWMHVESFFDADTCTFSHLIHDPATRRCAIVDSVLDFDARSGRTRTTGADRIVARVEQLRSSVQWLLETHVHADHLSAATYLRQRLGGAIAIGARVTEVQRSFGELFNPVSGFAPDGRQFDRLLDDNEVFMIGSLPACAMHTPGHTPACATYVVRDGEQTAAFVGDTLFMPDSGTAGCDFPGGDAATMYRSIRSILALPPRTRLFVCHDDAPGGRSPQAETTVAEQRAAHIHLRDGVDEAEFMALRQARDATLAAPQLLLTSVQVNMRAGHLTPPENNGRSDQKISVNPL